MSDILITSEYFGKFSDDARELLVYAGHNVIDNPYGHAFLTPDMIIPYAEKADAMICDLEHINRDVIDAARNLKIISRRGVGIDSVDVAYAHEKGIEVARTLGVVEPPVSELVMSYILEFSRKISVLSAYMHCGKWQRTECHSVFGKTLGIVGMGKIAFETARRAKAFGMKIVYSDMLNNEKAESEFDAVRKDFDEVLNESDFITLHLPLTDETNKMFNYDTICKMKPSAYLINTSRGAVVDEKGLYKAIRDNKIAGAAIDVFDREPEENSCLKVFDNVILTPHVGTFTQEIFIKMDIVAAQNVIDFLKKDVK